jgi:large conductance mechanosensitive channel
MKIIEEFKQFAVKGNVIDMAVGVIIGGAFGKIVTSLVNDLIMPPIGFLIGGMKFDQLKLVLKPAVNDLGGAVVQEAVTWNYGSFLQATVDFLLVAVIIFLMIKMINRLKMAKPQPVEPVAKSGDEVLLEEIRDILKNK